MARAFHEDYVAFQDEEPKQKKWLGKGAVAALGFGVLATCAVVATTEHASTKMSQLVSRTLASAGAEQYYGPPAPAPAPAPGYVPAPGPGPAPAPGPGPAQNPISQCASGVVALQSDLGPFLARCRGCVATTAARLQDSATVHVADPKGAPFAQWTVERIGDNRVALKSDIGSYLARCNNCITNGAYPDSAFVHVTDWRSAPFAQWTVETLGNGKVALKSDTGRYLARCRNCARGSPPDRAFVHSTTSNDAWAQWTVRCMSTYPAPSTDGEAIECEGDANLGTVYRFTGGQLRAYPTPEIAWSWDPDWANSKVADCSGVPRGPDMPMKWPPPTTEGQPVQCDGDANSAAVYRFTGGQLRLYPDPTIARSWDPNWSRFTTVDCTGVPRGPDMPRKWPPPTTEGQPVKCSGDANPNNVYRFTGGQLRLYPDQGIAASWDVNWARFTTVDCTGVPRGPDMPRKCPPPTTEGQSVRCENDPNPNNVYRFTGGQLRLYPSVTVAGSWDPSWSSATLVDCTGVPRGPDMPMKWPKPSTEGQSVKVDGDPNPNNVYRFTGGQLRLYPTPAIADSWDPAWRSAPTCDGSGVPRGPDMPMKWPKPSTEGQAVKVDGDPNPNNVYRFTGGQLRLYPTPAIADSWDPTWRNAATCDGTGVPRGPDMPMKWPKPSTEGQAVKVDGDPNPNNVYRFTGGQLRLYPTPAIADSWDPAWRSAPTCDGSGVPRGPDMPMKWPKPSTEGQSVKVDGDPNPNNVYRFTGGQLRLYPTPAIADSWDPAWRSAPTCDGSGVPRGPDMPMKWPKPSTEGQSVKVDGDPNPNNVYRFTGGQLRLYPTPAIADSWDPAWRSAPTCDGSGVPRGPDMPMKWPKPSTEGQAVKVDGDPNPNNVYRFTGGQLRLYPTPAIADSWDPTWRNAATCDGTGVPRGPDMPMKWPKPSTEGQAVKVDGDPNPNNVYRFTGGQLRLYPTPAIADSWDPTWRNAATCDGTGVPRGPDMPMKWPKPSTEGQAVKVDGDPNPNNVYRFTGGQLRLYPTPAIADSWDPTWRNAATCDGTGVPRGPDMPMKWPKPSTEGQAVKVDGDPNPNNVYRFTGGQLRLYPTPAIADSWDPTWRNAATCDGTGVPRGPDMPMKWPKPSTEGQSVKCDGDPNPNNVYRFTGGQLRLYPSPAIASSWDPSWNDAVTVDCTGVPRGPDMPSRSEWVTLAGKLNQIDFDGQAICGVNVADDIFTAVDNIRTRPSWRNIPGKLVQVVKCGNRLYGVARADSIWGGSATGDPQWRQLPGGLRQIECDGKRICGTNRADDIWCADQNIDSNPNWRQVPGKLKQVVISDDTFFGVNSQGQIWTAPFSYSPQWQQLPGEAAQISVNKGRICGVLSNDDIFCSVNGWRYSIPGKLIGTSVGDEDLFGVNRNSDVFYRWIGRDTDRYANCPNVELEIANFVPELSDTGVQVLRLTVPRAFQDSATSVSLTADNGLIIGKQTLSFSQGTTSQTVRVRVGATPANGARLNLRVEWTSDRCGSRTRVLTYTVKRTPGCRGHSNGDPHMLSLDGVGFDFQRSGYFNLVQTRGLRVDIKMYKCGANLAYSCSDAVAIRNGDSVVRFFIRNNVMLLSRATQELSDLSVFQAKGNPNSYRVFVLSDPSTYIDISMGIYMNRGYFDVAAVLSPYMRADGNVAGLLGNGNGRPGDDLTAPDSLELLWTISPRDNLIVASGDALTALLAPHNEDDDLALPTIPALEAAYNLLPAAVINYLPNIAGSLELVSVESNAAADAFVPQHLDEGKVRALCTAVISSIPHCKDVAGDASFYIENLCVRDTVAGGDIGNIDNVKLSFLDECRRALNEKDILAGGHDAAADSELKELDLANPRECKDNCNGRGQCVTNGCHCNAGYTGWGCSMEVSVSALAVAVA